MDIQLCIVTGQALANLIPLLQEMPDRVALVVSEDMQQRAETFRKTLVKAGLDESTVDLYQDLPANNYESILMRAMEIEEDLSERYPGARIVFNATGGNKLMALAFMSVFGEENDRYRVIYTDTRNQCIEVLKPRQEKPDEMQSVLDLDLYLKAEGKTIRRRQNSDEAWLESANQRKPATRFLAENASKLEDFVGIVNSHYAPDNGGVVAPKTLTFKNPPRGVWLKALQLLEKGGVLNQGKDTMEWYPKSKDSARYLSGAWLEEYVWHVARDAGANEVALSLQFTDDFSKDDLRNEVDIAILHRNHLLLVECKTGNVARDGKDQDIVYKLDSLVDQAGGTLGEGLLVSFKKLEHITKKGRKVNVRDRASSVDLYTSESDQLSKLGKNIKHWLKTTHWPAE